MIWPLWEAPSRPSGKPKQCERQTKPETSCRQPRTVARVEFQLIPLIRVSMFQSGTDSAAYPP